MLGCFSSFILTDKGSILPYPILPFSVLYYTILSYRILSYLILSYPILSYPVLLFYVLPFPIISYPLLSSSILFLFNCTPSLSPPLPFHPSFPLPPSLSIPHPPLSYTHTATWHSHLLTNTVSVQGCSAGLISVELVKNMLAAKPHSTALIGKYAPDVRACVCVSI